MDSAKLPSIEMDYLISGAGPAGASLASFLGQNGLKGLAISSAPGTADTPRAHLINPFGLECLRDIGVQYEAVQWATTGYKFRAQRWCDSMAGREYGRVRSWGGYPDTARDTTKASPCDFLDLPQTLLEPILVKYATHHGFSIRFSTKLIDVTRISDTNIICTVRDLIMGATYHIKTRYLFGADGGRSIVAKSLEFNFKKAPSFGVACNVLVDADLGHLMEGREAQLHWIMTTDKSSRLGVGPTMRMVRPWNQWLIVAFTPGTAEDPFKGMKTDNPELIRWIRDLIGDDSVDISVKRLDSWVVRETIATHYSIGHKVHLLGDAAHRHPPGYGLGSNTCIQDAYNLAWKVAYVSKGLAGPGLLDTYDTERQPVGAELVREANNCMDAHAAVWKAMGMLTDTAESGVNIKRELEESTQAGASRRAALHNALEGKRREGESLGLTMNLWYTSKAVYLDDEREPRPDLKGDRITQIQISTFPGSRLPHAWLTRQEISKIISTQDLAGHGAFCLFTGNGGDAWRDAASKVSQATGVPINSCGIGFGLDYIDLHREWHYNKGIMENGCVLVRPDRYVAWRSNGMIQNCADKLLRVLTTVLHLPTTTN